MTQCSRCGSSCVPMADYEPHVICLRCDAARDAVLVVNVAAPRRRPHRVVVPIDLTRPIESYYGPAAPEVIKELVDAICPDPKAKAVPA